MSLINRFPMLLVLIYASIFSLARSDTLLRKLSDDSDLSEFYGLLERNKIAMSSLEYRAVTLFVPTNQAFQRFTGNTTHILYHMSTVATTLEQLGSTIFSDLEGNPPLYITRKRDGSQEEIYVNNARILKSRSNIQAVNEQGKKQVMHVIDDVLVPLTTTPTSTNELYNPDAFQFLTNADSLEIGGHRIRSYRQRVIMMKKESVYQAVGGHTFLIPIEEGFRPSPRPDLIDKKVIDGHVIPHTVIFTSSAPMEQPMTTMAFEDNIKVSVSFFQQKDGPTTKTYVKSNTLIGDGKHSVGVVLAEIVKANIPVRNGVIHLIHRPLMIVDTTVIQFLKIVTEKEDGPLYKFYEVIMDVGGQFMEDINNMSDVTILAPSNEAWNNPHVENVLSCPEERFEECLPNKEKMKEILNLHIIRGKMNVERIRQENHNSIAQIATNEPRKYLYFNIINNDGNETVTVEGGGVNATIIQADIAQTNGYVHIINNVLGIASSTVYEKISTDPMMNATYLLGKGTDFNKQLNDTSKRFTFFVPGEKAWARTATEYPSAHKKLFMKDFAYHARSILERHLVIADRVYTIGDLKPYENDSIVLNTMRDSLKIRVREQKNRNGYEIMWNNRWIQIYRPDVECTNGIIHVIDEPFLQESDIRVTGGTSQTQVTYNILFANFLMILIAKLLL